jgi:hypothetical protein
MKFIYSATLAGALIAAAGVVIFQKFGSEQSAISKKGPSSGSAYGQKSSVFSDQVNGIFPATVY